MEAIVKQRQAEIDASIAREEASLAAITESLESADQMTKQMEYILENFGARLGKLEEAVVPIHKQTKDLQEIISKFLRLSFFAKNFKKLLWFLSHGGSIRKK